MSTKKFYLFRGILSDYTPGIAGAIASNKKEAIDLIVERYLQDRKIDKKRDNYLKKVLAEEGLTKLELSDNNLPVPDFCTNKVNEKYPLENYTYVDDDEDTLRKDFKNATVTVHDLDETIVFYNSGGS